MSQKNFFKVSLDEITRLFIVRHGKTDDSAEGRMSSRSRDISINQEGVEQVKLLAQRLKGYGISKIYSSPQRRTRETTKILNDRLKTEVVFDERLMEYDFGVLSDRTLGEVEEEYPDLFDEIITWINASATSNLERVNISGAEPFDKLTERINSLTQALLSQHLGEKIVLVTHGGFIKSLLTHYAGGNISLRHGRFMASTASLSVVDFHNGIPMIQSFNDTAHLREEEVRFGRPLVL